MQDTVIDGVAISPSVVETIAGIAVNSVPGVRVYNSVFHGIPSIFQSLIMPSASKNVITWSDDEDSVSLEIHVSVSYDVNSLDIANKVREAVNYALMSQMGISTDKINIIIESMGEL